MVYRARDTENRGHVSILIFMFSKESQVPCSELADLCFVKLTQGYRFAQLRCCKWRFIELPLSPKKEKVEP